MAVSGAAPADPPGAARAVVLSYGWPTMLLLLVLSFEPDEMFGGPRNVIVELNTTPLCQTGAPTLWQQQDVDIYLQRVCKTFNVVDRDISYLAFNVRHEGAVQARFQREIFLRPSPFLAEANYVHRKELTRLWRA